MKTINKLLTLILTAALALGLALPAAASSQTKQATVTYRGITVKVDGSTIVPLDESGKQVEPFIIGGTTYLPVRAVANALGLKVAWDDATSTVALSKGATANMGSGTPIASNGQKVLSVTTRDIKITLDGQTITPKDEAGKAVEPFISGGTTYLPLRAVAGALGVDVDWDNDSSTVYLGKMAEWIQSSGTYYNADGTVNMSTSYKYDAEGRITEEKCTDTAGGGYTESYTYSASGLQVKDELRYDDGTYYITETVYDAAGNVVSEKYTGSDGGYTSNYIYDENGNIQKSTSISMDGYINTEEYSYDAAGNMTKCICTDTSDPEFNYTETISYDAAGNMTSDTYTYANGDVASNLYTYNSKGQLIAEKNTDIDGMVTSSAYSYNAKGQCVKYTDTTDGDTTTTLIDYDKNGNVTRKEVRQSDGKSTVTTYIYDSRGNQIKMEAKSSDGQYVLLTNTYNSKNQLTATTTKMSGTSAGASFSYEVKKQFEYDLDGNLTKTVLGDGTYVVYTYIKHLY